MSEKIVEGQQTGELPFVLWSGDISQLEGEFLTFVDAICSDPVQRKAAKDILRPKIWDWAMRSDCHRQWDMKVKPLEEQGINPNGVTVR